MKRICLFMYLWSEAVASKWATGNVGVSLHPTLGQLLSWLYIQVQTYMQERKRKGGDGKYSVAKPLTPGSELFYHVLLFKKPKLYCPHVQHALKQD